MIQQMNLLFRLRLLECYEKTMLRTDPDTDKLSTKSEYWWAEMNEPQGHGPFNTLYACMRDYENHAVAKEILADPEARKSLISVDFKNKKRTEV
jgi:hypothetical protein